MTIPLPASIGKGKWSYRSFTFGPFAQMTVVIVPDPDGGTQNFLEFDWGYTEHGRAEAEYLAKYLVAAVNEYNDPM